MSQLFRLRIIPFCHIPQGGDIPNSSSSVSSQSPQSPGTLQRLQKWNPMESDFLAERNNYKIDDEDTVSALHGYSKLLVMVVFYFTLHTNAVALITHHMCKAMCLAHCGSLKSTSCVDKPDSSWKTENGRDSTRLTLLFVWTS